MIPRRTTKSIGAFMAIPVFLIATLLFVPRALAQADAQLDTPRPMNSIVVSSMAFAIVFGAAMAGRVLRRALPEDHLGTDAKDVIKLTTGLVGTLAALVLGMLVSSAKTSYDARKNEVALMSSQVVAIDRLLANYGPETKELREGLRAQVEAGIDRIWPSQASRQAQLRPTENPQSYFNGLRLLAPKNDVQAATKAEVISMSDNLRQTRWLLFIESEQSSVPRPLLVILIAWLAVIFISFGLFAPPNPTVAVTLFVGALAVSAAIFIILEMYTPFSGVLRISSAPVREALSQIGH